jgi:hypothetical protein
MCLLTAMALCSTHPSTKQMLVPIIINSIAFKLVLPLAITDMSL